MVVGIKEKSEQIKENDITVYVMKRKSNKVRVIIFSMIIVVLSGLYLIYSWNKYQDVAESEAIMLAESLESVIHSDQIAKLSGSAEDLEKSVYKMTKQSLIQLVETTNPIRFAYLMGERNGGIVFLMDSEPSDSVDYSPPGQIYEDVEDALWDTFSSGKSVLTQPATDRWGTWISVFVPMKDPINGNVLAIFGIDYSASEWYAQIWKHMIPDMVIVISILMLSFTLLYGWIQFIKNKFLSEKLSKSEAFYHSVFDRAPVGIAIFDNKGFIAQSGYGAVSFNQKYEDILGRVGAELTNLNWMDITHPDDLQEDLEKYKQLKNGEISCYSMDKCFLRPDGSSVWANMSISRYFNTYDSAYNHVCIIQDITNTKEMEELLKENNRKQAVLLSNLPGLAYRCNYDCDWTMQFVSAGCLELTGYHPDSLLGNKELSFNDLITTEYDTQIRKEWECALAQRAQFRHEYEITTASGGRKWVVELGQGIFNEQGEVEALEGIIFDISDRKEMENNIRYIKEHDRWTGLYNRDHLEDLIEIDGKQKKTPKRALIVVNLSTVQSLTVNYGFHYTQNLMKKVVETLDAFKTDERTLFKTHDNRFTFYLKNYKDKIELINFSKIIATNLKELFITERVGGGIGILEINQDNDLEADLLLRRLLIASERSINEFDEDFIACFYNEELEISIKREGDIREELARIAVDDTSNDLFLQYQPILDLKTNSICGFEALARLKTEKLGLVSPVEFIPIAEKTKLIIPLGKKIIIDAFCFLNNLRDLGYDSISVDINISAIQLLKPDFTSSLFDMISEMNVNPQNIGIELTESIFASDHAYINNIICKLRDAGLHISIDDFGTGYSSLAREKELNVNYLKIDKYFIDKLFEEDPDKAITGDIISIAHRLGHRAIAEGVEQEIQKQYLLSHGCDKIQGYLVSRPLDEEAAVKFLSKQENCDDNCRLSGSQS